MIRKTAIIILSMLSLVCPASALDYIFEYSFEAGEFKLRKEESESGQGFFSPVIESSTVTNRFGILPSVGVTPVPDATPRVPADGEVIPESTISMTLDLGGGVSCATTRPYDYYTGNFPRGYQGAITVTASVYHWPDTYRLGSKLVEIRTAQAANRMCPGGRRCRLKLNTLSRAAKLRLCTTFLSSDFRAPIRIEPK